MIAPLWTKVSQTPFYSRAVICGGFGKKMSGTSISTDSPAEWINPHKVPKPPGLMDRNTASLTYKVSN